MRLRLEGDPEELREKAPDLVKALAERLGVDLQKALPAKEQELKYPALRALQKQTTKIYLDQMAEMDREIQKVVSKGLKKGGFDHEMDSDGAAGNGSGMLHKEAVFRRNLEQQLRGDLEHVEHGHDHRDQYQIVKADFTKPIADKDQAAYDRTKAIFKQRGYQDTDFDEGGVLYGLSTNELRELLKEMG